MRATEITVSKKMKVGLPNYSNIDCSASMTFELAENETPDWDAAWDEVNRQVGQQVDNLDPAWITTKEYKNFFRVTTKVPKT